MKIINILLIMVILTVSVYAKMPLPDSYRYNECEKTAKDFQKEFGGSLVFIQPLTKSGAYDLGESNGHFINKIYISGNKKFYYIDWGTQSIIGTTKEDVYHWYKEWTFRKSEIWDLSNEYPPFGMIWKY